ncbi:MAG: CoA-binding protein [Gemmatales bacterium]|nr:CoA-binding protein [Gemmatales bacterium]
MGQQPEVGSEVHTGACELPQGNPSEEEIRRILNDIRVVAIVGLSDKPDRDSYRVAAYLKQQGYRIIPVNPNIAEVLGERAYRDLREILERPDAVVVFRRPEVVPEIAEQAIQIGAKVLWLQLGIVHNAAAERARAAGISVVQNRCIMQEHRRFLGPSAS